MRFSRLLRVIFEVGQMRVLRRSHCLWLLVAVLGLPAQSRAIVVTWNISTGGSWTTSANWSPQQVPGASDQAVIGPATATSSTVNLDGDQTVYGYQASPGSGKTAILASGTPATSKLIVLSTDTTSDGSTTFFALSGTNGSNNAINAPVQLGNGSSGSFTATFNSFVNASNFVINGAITESPGQTWGVRIVGNGPGIVNYTTTAKTYSGDTTIAANGILKINTNDNLIPDGAGKGNVVLEGNGQLQLNNINETINGLSSTSATAAVSKSGSNTKTLTVGGGNANASYAGTVSFGGGNSTISKIGTGAQTFSGAVSTPATAVTNVGGGTLLVNTSSWTPAVTVAGGGTLAGTGAITGAVTVQGNGTLAPGNNVGALSSGAQIESLDTGALSFNAMSNLAYELASTSGTPAADLVNANGNLTIAAGALASITDIAGVPSILPGGTKFTLISYAGTWNNGVFAGKADDSTFTIGLNQFVIDYNGLSAGSVNGGLYTNAVTLTTVVAAIPEASAFLCGVAATGVCLVGQLRRRRQTRQQAAQTVANM